MNTSTTSESLRSASDTRLARALQAHPDALTVPPIGRESFAALRDDIKERGIQVPLDINQDGVVLDGHLRLQAATGLGLEEVPVRVVNPPDEFEYLVLAAVQRRHLEPGQRVALVLELDLYQAKRDQAAARKRANLKQHEDAEVADLPPRGKSRDFVAVTAGTSARTVQNVMTVKAADQLLFEEIKQGRIAPNRAARQVKQRQRDATLPSTPRLPEGVFDLIYADPPWRLPGSPDSSRAVENHYPTLPPAAVKTLEVPAAENAILFLWGVNSLTPLALEVIEAWGFTYLTNFAWDKEKIGLGQYNRCQHELLHIARRGRFSPPAEDKRFSSVIRSPRRRHSEKPAQVYEMLETMYPQARKLELFARTTRPGWTGWGNQVAAEEGSK